jgi:hypothetical protein
MTHLFSFVGRGRCARLLFCTHLKQSENQAKKDFCPIKRNAMEIKCLSHGKKKRKYENIRHA